MNDKGKKSSSRVAITALVALAFLSVATQPAFAEPTPAPAPAATGNAISGTVVDSEGEPIIGATVLIKGTDQGASTDLQTPGNRLHREKRPYHHHGRERRAS